MNLFKTHIRGSLVACALVVAAFAAAGCGSSSDSASGSGSSSDNAQDAAQVKLAQCMRENGVDVPDDPGSGGAADAIQNVDPAKLQAAFKACEKYQRGAFGNVDPSQQQEFRDAFTKFASCMRQHGVEIPDIGSAGAGGGPPAGGGQIDQDDPKVKAAQQACQDKLPAGGPGGQGGSQ